ncbi:hypothetical protein [Azotobacter vinelandii]|uniref:hypothetical protein n=1 Tax=Azotobacter vinelandii TaxID=354 RepID=UPI0012E7F692|nr:hypothetical protein [Azotobacter vinelandii]
MNVLSVIFIAQVYLALPADQSRTGISIGIAMLYTSLPTGVDVLRSMCFSTLYNTDLVVFWVLHVLCAIFTAVVFLLAERAGLFTLESAVGLQMKQQGPLKLPRA